MAGVVELRSAEGERQRLSRASTSLEQAASAARGQRRAAGAHPRGARPEQGRVRLATGMEAAARPGHPGGQGAGSQADAAARDPGARQAQVQGDHGQQSLVAGSTEPARAGLLAGHAERGVDERHHVRGDGRRLAVPDGDPGPVQPADRGLVDEAAHAPGAGGRRAAYGVVSPPSSAGPDHA